MNKIQYFQELGSTNTFCLENMENLSDMTAVVARMQTDGRGRRGKNWTAHNGKSLAMSIVIKKISAEDILILPILTGIAVVECLEQNDIKLGLKWPNDVLYQGKKICGILCESRISGKIINAVCGTGINLNQTIEDFSDLNTKNIATSLQIITGKTFSVEDVSERLFSCFEQILTEFYTNGFEYFIESYKSRCVNLGKELTIYQEKTTQSAFGIDINIKGELVCRLENGEIVAVRAGEVSIRTSDQAKI